MKKMKSEGPKSPLRPGLLLEPNSPLRHPPRKGKKCHANQLHSGAPWHPDYLKKTLAWKPKASKADKAPHEHLLPYLDRSFFDSVALIDDAVRRSADLPTLVSYGGNLIVFVDFGHEIGFDAWARRRTCMATVIIRQESGEVITVYPGRPDEKDLTWLIEQALNPPS